MHRETSAAKPVATPVIGLPSLFRGVYNRVARQLGVDPSYVSRVARGERRSEAVQLALGRETKKILVALTPFPLQNSRSGALSASNNGDARKKRARTGTSEKRPRSNTSRSGRQENPLAN